QSRLEFRYLGYVSQTVTVGERQVINVQLTEDTKALDEVVVVGYGTQKKASLTGAISQIRGEEAFKDRGINNVSVALQGEIPGLVVTRSSTRPGSEGAAMKIRGDISVNGNSSPLVLIDGIAGSLDELNQMEPNDIENISVLKDASAAIYGARSASGVMLVTTKRGKKGKAKITYNGSVSNTIDGIQTPLTSIPVWLNMFYDAQYQDAIAQNPTLTDPKEIHGKINWWIFGSVLGGDKYTGEDLFNALLRGENFNQTLSTGRITRYEPTSLMDAMYGQANSQKHSFSVSGADDKFGYMASLGFADNNSQLRVAQDGEKKYSGRLNMDYQATKALKFETGMSYEIRDITTPRADIGQGYTDPWFWPVTNPQGQYFDVFGSRNPIGGLVEGGQIKTNFNTMRSNIKATLNLSEYVDGLSISGTGGYKTVGKDIQTLTKKIQYYDYEGTMTTNRQSPGSLGEELNKWESVTLGGFLNYERSFNAVHNVSAMLGMTAEQESTKKITASRNNGPLYEESDMVDLEVMVSGTNNGAGGGQSSWGFVSYITRLNYNYQYKYLLEFLGRRDGSSRLAVSQRWKNFFAVSGGWVISEEDFMKEISLLSNLKIRYNYGKTGSVEGINNYERYATMSSGSAFFGTDITAHPSLALGGMTSDTRTWETIISHNAGLDFAFLGNRLSGSFDYFSKTNDGMFIPVTYPAILGATAPKTNNGKFSAKGWEFAIKWVDKIGDVTYNIGGSIADASSKVLELENNENVPNPGKNSNRLIGKPRDVIYAYKTDGIFQTQKEADDYYDKYYWNADHTGPKSGNIIPAPAETAINRLRPGARKVTDLDGDGAITTKDTYYAGDAAPHYTYGIKAGLEWKGIDFQAFLQGVGQQTILRTGYFAYPWVNNYMLLNSSYAGKLWTTDNPNTDYTVASRDNGFNNWNYANKDVLVQNSSYLRLKSLTIGYTLPGMWTSKVMLEKVRFYFSGDDLWEWTEIKDGYDPEYGENSNNTFPFSRLLSFGIDVTF
ncbi:MAG: SusC/RagA family TonB-linked outer membrane protein, partial [Tannerella sp.]|nr:SusC/RagA family TonB-linked outer membrane protein [Tannerella sp.]